MVIGKSGKPKTFENVNLSDLPAQYKSEKSAWMNYQQLKEWFFKIFVPTTKQFLKEKKLPQKAILLIIDNASCHPFEKELCHGDIFVKFLKS